MNHKNRTLSLLLAGALTLGGISAFAGCGKNDGTTVKGTFDYETEMLSEMESDSDYNGNLFYVNTLDFAIADPTVIFVTKGKDKGYFYAYGTSDDIGCHGIQAWRSKDLAHWECTGVAYQPDYNETWAVNNYWAPEVIYDEDAAVYYMFYNAYNILDSNRLCLSVAYSETPDGPFLPPAKDGDGNLLSKTKPVFDVTVNNPVLAQLATTKGERFLKKHALDASPFIDPDTKEKYLYFSYYDDYGEGSFIYGMKMNDWYTPDYSTLTRLTYPGYSTVAKGEAADRLSDRSEGGVNEGPFMVKHNGKYYMTFSVFGYMDPQYKVIQAIADQPLGTFEKVDPNGDGGIVVSTDVVNWDHIVSAGHHCFIYAGDELFIAYHTFKNRMNINGGRALAVDRVEWIDNGKGVELMHTNGPTYSVQPLPAAISGYKNIAPSATVTASNTADYSDDALLTDNVIKYKENDLAEEYIANAGTSEITLSWDDYKTVRGLMIYNSWEYELTFAQVAKVEMEYLKADGSSAWITMSNLKYDWDWFFDSEYEFVRPGGAAVAEFDELAVKTIKITVRSADGAEELGISEIVVLGKDAKCAGVSAFKSYSYENKTYGSPQIVRESKNFGNIAVDGVESRLKTMYGYDLSHDDGTQDAYILQTGCSDQYAYFKDVYSTDLYIEASFTVTSGNSYIADLGSTYPQGDPYPKFGIAVSCDDSDSGIKTKNTIFYYVDSNSTYTNTRVGIAQRAPADTDWDWTATEKSYDQPGIKYKDGETVTLAILRKGKDFWLFCNGKLVTKYSQFHTFTDGQRAGVGFLSFNTPMKITNYFATADATVIAQKLSEVE